jgi:DNA-binding GntR family transcriptional regulator
MAQKDKYPTLMESVLDRIRQDIITCTLAPGEVIKDNELVSRYGVSTSPIREALVQLAMESLVEILPNKMKRVTPLDPKSVQDFMAVHKVLAFTGFAWGAPHVRASELKIMSTAYSEMEQAYQRGDHPTFAAKVREFLDPVFRASGNIEMRKRVKSSAHWLERLTIAAGASVDSTIASGCRDMLSSFWRNDFTAAIFSFREMTEEYEKQVLGADFSRFSST